MLVIQQRSPVLLVRALCVVSPRPPPPDPHTFLQPRKQEFVDTLSQFLRESKFSATLFLSGVDMSNRTDAQMMFVTSSSSSFGFVWLIALSQHAHVLYSPTKFSILGEFAIIHHLSASHSRIFISCFPVPWCFTRRRANPFHLRWWSHTADPLQPTRVLGNSNSRASPVRARRRQ